MSGCDVLHVIENLLLGQDSTQNKDNSLKLVISVVPVEIHLQGCVDCFGPTSPWVVMIEYVPDDLNFVVRTCLLMRPYCGSQVKSDILRVHSHPTSPYTGRLVREKQWLESFVCL